MIIIPLADILISGQHAAANVPIEVSEAVGSALLASGRAMTGELTQSSLETSDAGVLDTAEAAVLVKGKKRK